LMLPSESSSVIRSSSHTSMWTSCAEEKKKKSLTFFSAQTGLQFVLMTGVLHLLEPILTSTYGSEVLEPMKLMSSPSSFSALTTAIRRRPSGRGHLRYDRSTPGSPLMANAFLCGETMRLPMALLMTWRTAE